MKRILVMCLLALFLLGGGVAPEFVNAEDRFVSEQIRLLPGNTEAIVVRQGVQQQTPENAMSLINREILVEVIHDGVSLRQEDDGFGELIDVYRVQQIRTVNNTPNSYHVVLSDLEGAVWEHQVDPGRETVYSLVPGKQFETFGLAFSMSYIRD